MPAVSAKQQHLMGMVLAEKRGKMKNPSAKVKHVAAGMSESTAKEFAQTKKKGAKDSKRTMLAKALM